jgi:FeS assembly SUF system protein
MRDNGTERNAELKAKVVQVLKTVYDPEIPVDIYELGLIYKIEFDEETNVRIEMTLTSPACPVAGSLPVEIEHKTRTIDGVKDVTVDIVWDPPWNPDMMSEAARLELNM